jgi:hypothetical protein
MHERQKQFAKQMRAEPTKASAFSGDDYERTSRSQVHIFVGRL